MHYLPKGTRMCQSQWPSGEELRDTLSLPLPVLPIKLTGESPLASQYFLPTQEGEHQEEDFWKGQWEAELRLAGLGFGAHHLSPGNKQGMGGSVLAFRAR